MGRKVGRTIYAQMGPQPSDTDPMLGVTDGHELARASVAAHNYLLADLRRLADAAGC